MKTTDRVTVLLFKNGSEWTVSSFAGASVVSKTLGTAKAAKAYAKSKGWAIRRAPDCDD